MGIEVEAEYEDEGMGFEGRYVNGENKSWWVPELEEEDA